jgi:hypothetical protein
MYARRRSTAVKKSVRNKHLSLLDWMQMESPNEQQFKGCKIVLAPSYTDTGSWTCGYSVIESGSGTVTLSGYMHGPFTTAERAKRAALREAKEQIDHMIRRL